MQITESPVTRAPRARNSRDAADVLLSLRALCAAKQPGESIPTHTVLMREMGASQRSVLWALEELQKQGTILRRPGAPTVVAGVGIGAERNRTMGGLSSPNMQKAAASRSLVLVTEPDGSAFDQAFKILVGQAKAAGLALTCRLMQSGEGDEAQLLAEQCDRFLVFREKFLPLARSLQQAGNRVVLVGNTSPHAGVPNVYGDHEEGSFLMVRHLLNLGHRRFLIQGNEGFELSRRGRGAARALATCPGEVKSTYLSDELLASWNQKPALVTAFFGRPQATTALVAWNDHCANLILTLLNRAGLRVPEDVSLSGYDNLPWSANLHPALTTIDGGMERQLDMALRLLTQAEPPARNQSVIVLPNLIERESTAKLTARPAPNRNYHSQSSHETTP